MILETFSCNLSSMHKPLGLQSESAALYHHIVGEGGIAPVYLSLFVSFTCFPLPKTCQFI